jgi:L-threonylcarbamoyladenylate synthase
MTAIIGKDIEQAAARLKEGGLVAIPTETVYGLGANALNEKAVLKVFEAKNRPSFDPLITHIAEKEELYKYASEVPEKAQQLIDAFWPGPLTLVLPKNEEISSLISSGLDTAAFRMPRHPLLHSLLTTIDFPLVAPSANPFGYVSPTSARHVFDQLGDKIDYILDGGPTKIGLESTIVGFREGIPTVLRLGGLSVEAIEQVVGKIAVNKSSTSKPDAPGMLISHYSPSKKVILGDLEALLKIYSEEKKGILSFSKNYPDFSNFVLSEQGDLAEAATRLFAGLRWFESQDVDVILTEPVPDHGLGRAINDRLKRASYK